MCWLDHWLSCMLDYIHVCVFLLSKNCFEKLARHLLDTSSIASYLSRITEDLYICSLRSGSYFLDLSWSVYTCSPPKSLSLTPNLFPKWFSSIFKVFSSLGMPFFSHLHAFHVLKPRFWDFLKNFGVFQNWWAIVEILGWVFA